MLNLKLMAVLFLLIGLVKSEVIGMSLWDQVVKKEHVFLTVEYEQRHLNVWRQDSHGYSRFYVTPLCVMEIDSITCSRDEYSNVHRHIFEFSVHLWNSKAAKVVQNALKQKNVDASLSDILPLPMQMVRVGLGGKDLIVETDNQWRSNQDQPHAMAFELYTRHEHFCNKMISDARNNTKHFLRAIKPYFEFTMVVGQHETRNFNLTGRILQRSSFFTELVNKHADKNGIVYLHSKDLNRLTRDLYNKIALDEEITAGYISTTQEQQIIKELLDVFKEQQIQSNDLTQDEWNSVFWDDIFARPDIQTDYANEVLKYDEKEKKFTYDAGKDHKFRETIKNKYNSNHNKELSGKARFSFLGIFKVGGGGKSSKSNYENNENENDTEKNEKIIVNFDDFNKTITKENINIKWKGTKFEPKDLTLSRLNTKNLNFSNEIYFKRVVVTKYQTTQKIEIKASGSSGGLIESYIDPDLQYSFQSKKMNFMQAEGFCYGLKGHLVTINSMFENMFLSEKASTIFTDSISDTFWIGASDTVKTPAWSWIDKSSFGFKNWVKGQPQNTSDSNCGAALIRGGKWITDSCDKLKQFVCEFNASISFSNPSTAVALNPNKCPESWIYYSTTGFCYKLIQPNTTWQNAEALCVKEDAHLASIHSYSENLFVTSLQLLANHSAGSTWNDQAWIGLSKNNGINFKWTDGTPLDYTSWFINYPTGENKCVTLWIGHAVHVNKITHGPTLWCNWYSCDHPKSNAICKKASDN